MNYVRGALVVICCTLATFGCGNIAEAPIDVETDPEVAEPVEGNAISSGLGTLAGGGYTFEVKVGHAFPQAPGSGAKFKLKNR